MSHNKRFVIILWIEVIQEQRQSDFYSLFCKINSCLKNLFSIINKWKGLKTVLLLHRYTYTLIMKHFVILIIVNAMLPPSGHASLQVC